MDARTGLSLDAFFGMLARTLPDRPHPPWTAIDFPPRILLCLFVHRIEGLSPGLYVLVRDEARLDAFRAASGKGEQRRPSQERRPGTEGHRRECV